jgi:hypothetical protein
MREADEAAERQQTLRTMTPACREKLRYFNTWLREEVSHTLRIRYELGCRSGNSTRTRGRTGAGSTAGTPSVASASGCAGTTA